MNRKIRYIINNKVFLTMAAGLLLSLNTNAQNWYSLSSILDSIENNNPVSRMYEAEIRSMDEATKGAKSWMPPEVGAEFFMTPYNPQRWKKMNDMAPGMGNFMVSMQQMIPNRKK